MRDAVGHSGGRGHMGWGCLLVLKGVEQVLPAMLLIAVLHNGPQCLGPGHLLGMEPENGTSGQKSGLVGHASETERASPRETCHAVIAAPVVQHPLGG